MMPSYCVAEKLGVPWVPMILGPTLPTTEFPIWPLKSIAVCSCMNRWTYSFLFNTLWGQEKATINAWRQESLRLPALSHGIISLLDQHKIPVLIACSRLLCPSGAVPHDYPPYAHLKGFVFVPAPLREEDVAPELRAFVAGSGQQPLVYFGFGSMPVPDPAFLANIALECCMQLGVKGVVCAGWSGAMNDLPLFSQNQDKLLMVASAPHDWLFPRMSCLVHHCGVGTMAAALRSGVPSVPCPFMLDQPHNAQRLVDLKVASRIVPYSDKITASQLVNAIRSTLQNKAAFQAACAQAKAVVDGESHASLPCYMEVLRKQLGSASGGGR